MLETSTLITPETDASVEEWPRAPRWTREQYHRLVDLGLLEGRRVELIEGVIVEMSPMNRPHATAAALTAQLIREQLPAGHHVLEGYPFEPNDDSEPEPDVAVYVGGIRDYEQQAPKSALLIVEVSDSTLAFDRRVKRRLYAAGGIPEFWILNLRLRQLEVFRHPVPEGAIPAYYSEEFTLDESGEIHPLFAPQIVIRVGDVLPSKR